MLQKRVSKLLEYFIIISFVILIFQEVLVEQISLLQYYDEILGVMGVLIIFVASIKYRKEKLFTKHQKNILFLLILLIITGIFSNYISEVSVELEDILLDMFSLIKAFTVYIGLKILLDQVVDKESVIKKIAFLMKIYIVIALICGIINLVANIGMSYDVRYGIKSFSFIYRNPGTLNNIAICMIAVLTLEKKVRENVKNRKYLLATIIIMILTLRGKAFAMVGVYFGLKLFLNTIKKIKLKHIIIIGILAVVIGFGQIKEYYFNDITPRGILFTYGVETANEYMPLGAGFATYGSDRAAKSYSELYIKYGFYNYYGLSEEDTSFSNDNFWPMIIGQFGWIGFVIYLLILLQLYLDIRNATKDDTYKQIGAYIIYFSIVISTLAAAILTGSLGVVLLFTLALII